MYNVLNDVPLYLNLIFGSMQFSQAGFFIVYSCIYIHLLPPKISSRTNLNSLLKALILILILILFLSNCESMAAGISSCSTSSCSSRVIMYRLNNRSFLAAKPIPVSIFPGLSPNSVTQKSKIKKRLDISLVMEENRNDSVKFDGRREIMAEAENRISKISRVEERLNRKRSERRTYLIAAMMSTLGISSMAVLAVYYRFSWQMEGGDMQLLEMFSTFALSVGAAVGMEFWARWAHRALWHASLWHMHESHHRPRDGPFELNDVFAIINAVPAITLLSFGFFNKGLLPGLCFGAGLGITVFGMAYMFVHDGLVHRRFPVGPVAHVPYLRRVAAAHQLHHSERFNGLPYGLFLGPQEIEAAGGKEELDKEIQRAIRRSQNSF